MTMPMNMVMNTLSLNCADDKSADIIAIKAKMILKVFILFMVIILKINECVDGIHD